MSAAIALAILLSMKQLLRFVPPALVFIGAIQAQPRITSLLNNASYIVPPLPGSSIAQGSLFAVFGENMGPAALVQAGFPLPTDLSGASLRISASGNDVSAFLVYTSATQLAAILPSNTPVGPAVARVTFNNQQSAPFPFTVVRNSPGLFTLNRSGTGPAVLTTPDFKVITYTNAAVEGDVLSVWSTGVTGLTGRADNTAAEFFDPPLEVEVFVGGKKANVRYRGRAPALAGVDQVVFDVPPGVRGCSVSLAMRVGGVISNYSTLAVAGANRICSDPNGLTETDTAKALQNGLSIGSISLARFRTKVTVPGAGTLESRVDSASANFTRFDADGFIRSRSVGSGGASLGNCVVTTFSGNTAPVDPFATTKLNAGPQLTLTGPGGTRPINRAASGAYSADLGSSSPAMPGMSAAFLEPGTYTVTGPGGPDVGAFSTRITVPQPLTTNLDGIASVARGSSLTVTWSGGGSNEYIIITGTSFRRNPTAGATFVCTERSSAGRFEVPSEVLLAMPPSENSQGTALGFLSVTSAPLNDATRFTASGLDLGYVTYLTAESKSVPYE